MLMIRLQRVGRTNDPSFRVVVTDKRNATQSGKFLEVLGSYNARFGQAQLKKERLAYWLSHGAKPTATVHNLFVSHKLISAKKISFVKMLKKKSEVPTPARAAAPEVVPPETSVA